MMNSDFWSTIIWIAIGAAVVAWQLLSCFLLKRVILRLLPTIAAALATVVFFVMMYVGEGWEVLGYLLLMIFCAIMLGLCLACWIVFAIARAIRRRRGGSRE